VSKRNLAADPLRRWLALRWDRPERSYNPDVRDFLSDLLRYPRQNVLTEDTAGSGFADIKLLSPEGVAWVVGDLRRDDIWITDPSRRAHLWGEKRKYVDGLTRYALFLTPHYVWVALPNGDPVLALPAPLDLRSLDEAGIRRALDFISFDKAAHEHQWQDFTRGQLPYSYLRLDDPDTTSRLRSDLQAAFAELSQTATRALHTARARHAEYAARRVQVEQVLATRDEARRRAIVRLEQDYASERRLFEEAFAQFEQQYGREVEESDAQAEERILEAFVADSVAALTARVLFLRFVEDLGLTTKRRLSNGGPKNWAAFVDRLTGDARALVQLVASDVGQLYREPFAPTVFDWIHSADGQLDVVLQRLILRLNAYDFRTLSEEVLGDIYQQFLPPAKRKQLGEYYTPRSIVDWILDRTVWAHGEGTALDPACGSGSFLVRYAHRYFADAMRRGLDTGEARRLVQEQLFGFDLNPFAAFISHFHLMWALLYHASGGDPPQIHIYNLNSLLKDTDIFAAVGREHLPPGYVLRDEGRWRYVLGNPPYIRAERVKYSQEMQDLWADVWGQNADTGLVFLFRALTEWVDENGYLGMVVSGGYANSEAAAKVWRLVQPGGRAALRKLVWLEFVEENGRQHPVWDVARVPMIVIAERAIPQESDTVELHVPSRWPSDEAPVQLAYGDFFDAKVTPKLTGNGGRWGDYLLPLLHPEDVPILRKLYPNGSDVVECKTAVQARADRRGQVSWWTYGIQRGGVEVMPTAHGTAAVKVIGGRSLAMAWPGEPAGWVDLDAVRERPYGKLSLWGDEVVNRFLVVSEIGKAPFGALVTCSADAPVAALNTAVVALPSPDGPEPEAVAAYLSSKLARFYWGVRLRSGSIQGYYAHIYPRALEALPWPGTFDGSIQQRLSDGYRRLAELASRAKNNPTDWLLTEVEVRAASARIRLSDARLGLDFRHWQGSPTAEDLVLDGTLLRGGLLANLELRDNHLAKLVFLLLTATESDAGITRAILQRLVVPQDYTDLMQEYLVRLSAFGGVQTEFASAQAEVDQAVFEAFGLSDAEREHIERRLSTFPLDRLQPRYPWETTAPRPIRAYTEDRFR